MKQPEPKPDEEYSEGEVFLDFVNVAEQPLHHSAEEVAGAGDEHGPDDRADEVEDGVAPRRDATGAEDDGGGDAEAVDEAAADDDEIGVTLDPAVNSFGLQPQLRKAAENPVAAVAAEIKIDLVAGGRTDGGERDDQRHFERGACVAVGLKGHEAGDEQQCFAFEEGSDEHGEIAVGHDELLDVVHVRCAS